MHTVPAFSNPASPPPYPLTPLLLPDCQPTVSFSLSLLPLSLLLLQLHFLILPRLTPLKKTNCMIPLTCNNGVCRNSMAAAAKAELKLN